MDMMNEIIKELEKIEDKSLDVISGCAANEDDCLIEEVRLSEDWYLKEAQYATRKCVALW